MAHQLLLLLPEDIPDQRQRLPAGPEYAEITDDTEADRVGVRVLLAAPDSIRDGEEATAHPGDCVRVNRIRVNHCRVQAGGLGKGTTGRLLRRPVFAFVNALPIYGQVTSYEVTICHRDGETAVEAVHVEELAPVVVFLLFKAQISRRITTHAGLTRAHSRILDRLLGARGAMATRQIKSVLAGIAPVATHPDPSDQNVWMDPMSGLDVLCSVRHVVDFGFYKDGGRPSPDNTADNHYWENPSVTSVGTVEATPPRRFDNAPEPAVHVYMDASDTGLCARVKFDPTEHAMIDAKRFSINVPVPPTLRQVYSRTSSPYSTCPSQNLHGDDTQGRGGSGARSAKTSDSWFGCQHRLLKDNPYNWLSSPFSAVPAVYRQAEHQPAPFGPNLATFAGFIVPIETSIRNSLPVTALHSPVCSALVDLPTLANPSQSKRSNGSSPDSTPTKPNCASLVGLRYWSSSFY
ncbi:hypothetical protein PHMEG_00017849 [Phytophthora megakarya]|uniref:Uncharacterized protein n=1 Tax=Phytophthora megakarya TaxID=4795 RepID=A0A225VWU1_9STRA|nr:hypothetical protein PHMEG_00017849 [Phytophthora megakarya]